MLLFSHLELVHHVKGRVRVRYAANTAFKSGNVTSFLLSKEAIKKVRISPNAFSLVIEYDNTKMHKNEIIELLSLLRVGDIKEVADNIASQIKPLVRATTGLFLLPFLSNEFRFLTTLLASFPSIKSGVGALFKKGFNSDVLDATAISISLYRGDYIAANTTNFMLELGEYIEGRIEKKSTSMLRSLLVPKIDKVWVLKDGVEVEVDYAEVQKGDIVSISMGDSVGVDGIIVEGEALLNEVSMSGESTPVHKKTGDRVISGTIMTEGKIKIIAEQVGEETAVAAIANYVENSLETKSKKESEARKLADSLVPITLGLSSASYLISKDINRVASVFQADYSCALKLATPVAFRSGIYKAGLDGALVKGGDVLERMSECDVFMFDKTGTLTSGDLEIDEIVSLNENWSKDRVLSLAASIEEHYFHPVAKAVVKAARECECTHFHHSEVAFIVAHGVKAEVDNKRVVIGSRHYLQDDERIDFNKASKDIERLTKEGKSLLYIGYDGELLGIVSLVDHIRSSSAVALKMLKAHGVKKTVMLTGDHKLKADEVAKEIGIDEWHAELLPEDKAKIVKRYTSQGYKVAFVGDGINDAPSISAAHLGIAMAKGADIARITSDVTLLEDRIEIIAEVKEMADKTVKLIKSNYNMTLGVNSTILLFASMGYLTPVSTSFLHNGATIGILLNALKGVKLEK